MDAALLSTVSALAGTAIGARSSLFSTWMSTQAQPRGWPPRAPGEMRAMMDNGEANVSDVFAPPAARNCARCRFSARWRSWRYAGRTSSRRPSRGLGIGQ